MSSDRKHHRSPVLRLFSCALLWAGGAVAVAAGAGGPGFSHPSGIYGGEIRLEIVGGSVAGELRHTMDGTIPTSQSPGWPGMLRLDSLEEAPHAISLIPTNPSQYPDDGELVAMPEDYRERFGWRAPSGPVLTAHTIRVRAFTEEGGGPVVTGTYLVMADTEVPKKLPVVFLTIPPEELFDFEWGLYVPGIWFHYLGGWTDDLWGFPSGNYFMRGPEWERRAHAVFLDESGELLWEGDLGVRIHGGGSRTLPQKSLRLYARSQYGAEAFEAPFFGAEHRTSFQRLILRNAGQDSIDRGTLFRDGLLQGLVRHKRHLATQAFQPTVVFINGEYWGIHNLRERYDHRYMEATFGVRRRNLDYLENNAEAEEGSAAHYRNLLDFMARADMERSESLAHVERQMDVDQYLDYIATQLYFGNYDWPGNNIAFWRDSSGSPEDPPPLDGRWRWILVDTDLGFGSWFGPELDYLALLTTPGGAAWPNPDLATVVPPRRLMNNVARLEFVNRTEALLNTVFREDRVIGEIDRMEALFEPEMPRHLARWGLLGTMDDWRSNVEVLREFARRRPAYLRQEVKRFAGLGGDATFEVSIEPAGAGHIRVEDSVVRSGAPGWEGEDETFPFRGVWHESVPFRVEAVAEPGFRFAYWTDDPEADRARLVALDGHLELRAVFERIPPDEAFFGRQAETTGGHRWITTAGRFEVSAFPWCYHESIGWLFAVDNAGGFRTFFSPEHGWLSESEVDAPFFFSYEVRMWLSLEEISHGPSGWPRGR
ncbi:MAG: CotH kinase family protein [Opitutales bacterium]|nr:CotH kinase family protein [Opitutales bacterium]